jgi:hypothetical protein
LRYDQTTSCKHNSIFLQELYVERERQYVKERAFQAKRQRKEEDEAS